MKVRDGELMMLSMTFSKVEVVGAWSEFAEGEHGKLEDDVLAFQGCRGSCKLCRWRHGKIGVGGHRCK